MNRLRQPEDSDYDVLGISPGATDEEINSAFHQLIDGQGFKVGVPLNRQWLRARQIKDAHATLSDPVKRRAYDESLSGAPDPAPWAMTADDPATDELVLPESEPDAPELVEDGSFPDVVVPLDQSALADSEPEGTPNGEPESAAEEAVGTVHDEPPSADLAPAPGDDEHAPALALNDNARVSTRSWGVPAAVAAGLGLVLVSSWLAWNSQPPASETTSRVTANMEQASRAGPSFGSLQSPGSYEGAAASDSGEPVAPPGGPPAASDAPGGSDEVTGELAFASAAGGQAAVDTTPAGATPVAAVGSSAPREAAEGGAVAPTPIPPVADAQAIATAPVVTESSGSMVRSPPQWVGGGPTDADNRRGRYQGEVTVQVAVEPSGRVSNCAPVRGSGNAGLDAMTCRLIRERAQFTPALDAEGRPVASEAYTTIVWGRRRRR